MILTRSQQGNLIYHFESLRLNELLMHSKEANPISKCGELYIDWTSRIKIQVQRDNIEVINFVLNPFKRRINPSNNKGLKLYFQETEDIDK